MTDEKLELTPEVISAINGELAYVATLQEQGRADASDYGVTGQLLTLSTYTRKAVDAWVNNGTEEESLHGLRKVAAIAIRALIKNGCPRREGF